MTELQLGRLQMKIMRVLWEKKRATALEITGALNENEPVAHSTVQTVIRMLEQKSVVAHDVDNRTFIFYPLVKNEKITRHAVQDFIDHVFAGSAEGLVSYIIKNKYISSKEFKKIQNLFGDEDK
ncbi:BlaI/MecI/CopY family transcriptional regulator [Candidatus Latescibacterota bacterium]